MQNSTPEWFYKASFNDSFDWSKSISSNFSALFEKITLHDSYWESICLNEINETILSIRIDSYWNKAYTLNEDEMGVWPYLIIKIPTVFNISYDTVEMAGIIGSTSCSKINKQQIENLNSLLSQSNLFPNNLVKRLLECNEANKTTFTDVFGGKMEFLHDAQILLLLIEENGNYLDPSIEKARPFVLSVRNKSKGANWLKMILKILSLK